MMKKKVISEINKTTNYFDSIITVNITNLKIISTIIIIWLSHIPLFSNYEVTVSPYFENGHCQNLITVILDGETGPFDIKIIENNIQIESIFNLDNGTYTFLLDQTTSGQYGYNIKIVDEFGCEKWFERDVYCPDCENSNEEVIIDVITDCYCNDQASWSIVEVVDTNLDVHSYEWSHGGDRDPPFLLGAGEHSVTITDICGNQYIRDFEICNCGLEFSWEIDYSIIDGQGYIAPAVTIEGEFPPYTIIRQECLGGLNFNWSNGDETYIANDLDPGEYSVTITNDNGCSRIEEFEVFCIDSDNRFNPTFKIIAFKSPCNEENDVGSMQIQIHLLSFKLVVYDVTNRTTHLIQENENENDLSVVISDLEKGAEYIIYVQDEDTNCLDEILSLNLGCDNCDDLEDEYFLGVQNPCNYSDGDDIGFIVACRYNNDQHIVEWGEGGEIGFFDNCHKFSGKDFEDFDPGGDDSSSKIQCVSIHNIETGCFFESCNQLDLFHRSPCHPYFAQNNNSIDEEPSANLAGSITKLYSGGHVCQISDPNPYIFLPNDPNDPCSGGGTLIVGCYPGFAGTYIDIPSNQEGNSGQDYIGFPFIYGDLSIGCISGGCIWDYLDLLALIPESIPYEVNFSTPDYITGFIKCDPVDGESSDWYLGDIPNVVPGDCFDVDVNLLNTQNVTSLELSITKNVESCEFSSSFTFAPIDANPGETEFVFSCPNLEELFPGEDMIADYCYCVKLYLSTSNNSELVKCKTFSIADQGDIYDCEYCQYLDPYSHKYISFRDCGLGYLFSGSTVNSENYPDCVNIPCTWCTRPVSSGENDENGQTIYDAGVFRTCDGHPETFVGTGGEVLPDCMYLSGDTVDSRSDFDEVYNFTLSIFPNPFANNFNMKFVNDKGYEEIEYRIISSSGEIIENQILHVGNDVNIFTIDALNDKPDGIYMIQLTNNGTAVAEDRMIKINR